MVHQSQRQSDEKKLIAFQSQQSIQPYDPTTYFFHKYGSSFNQLQAPLTHTGRSKTEHGADETDSGSGVAFPVEHIKGLYKLVVKLLSTELLSFLDGISLEVYQSGSLKVFPYKSLSETLNLVMVSMLRELVKDSAGNFKLLATRHD